MVILRNELRTGKDPPPSFLEGLIIPLFKKGDSVDAMDYRPISLQQIRYQIIAKILAITLTKNSAYSDWRQLAGICAGTTDDGNGNDNVGRSFYGSGRTRLACSTKSSYSMLDLRKA